jgi:hypothetical protein
VHPLQGVPLQLVVLVEQVDVVALGGRQADVAPAHRRSCVRQVQHPHVAADGRHGVEPLRDPVGGAVVDEDHFIVVRRKGLLQRGADARIGAIPRVVDIDDHTDLHTHAASVRGHTWAVATACRLQKES